MVKALRKQQSKTVNQTFSIPLEISHGMAYSRTDQMSGKKFPRRGEVYLVDLEPAIGGETQKICPGLVVSNDIGDEVSSVVNVAPITSKVKNVYPFTAGMVRDF